VGAATDMIFFRQPGKYRIFFLMLAFAITAFLSPLQSSAATASEQPELNLSQYEGKVVYLDFWASWCGPCKLSFPFMKGLSHQYSSRDLVVVTINLDRSRAVADAFLRQVGSNLKVIYDSKGVLAKDYRVSDMPTSLLIDRTGKVRIIHKGFHPEKEAEYRAHVEQLIHE